MPGDAVKIVIEACTNLGTLGSALTRTCQTPMKDQSTGHSVDHTPACGLWFDSGWHGVGERLDGVADDRGQVDLCLCDSVVLSYDDGEV
jgi:hypothetical protein